MSFRSRFHFLSLLAVAAFFPFSGVAVQAATPDPMDWPNWRGPQQNRVSTEKGLIDKWNPEGGQGSNLLWKKKELAGRSTPIVLRGKLYTIVRDQAATANEREMVVCADAATGDIIWKHPFNVYLSEVPADRVGWSSVVGDPETGRIYAQGVCGYFCCLEGDTGKLVWDHSLHEELGLISTFGGRTHTPVVFEDSVLISAVIVGWGDEPKWGRMALPAHRVMCFDKATGELRWLNGTSISPYDTTWETPTVTPIAGQQEMVFSSGDGGVWALQPRTGKAIWNFPFARAGINVSPLVTPDGKVYTSQGAENLFGSSMGSVVALDGTQKGNLTDKELWRKFEVMANTCSPVIYDGRLYIVDEGAKMYVFDAKSGKQITKQKLGNTARSTPLVADGKLYFCSGNGKWWVLKPTDRGLDTVDQVDLPEGCESSPIVSHGRIYLSTPEYMYCIGSKDAHPEADPLPPAPKEAPITDHKISTVQVVPCDVLLSPGESQKFKARFFNALGQALQSVDASKAQFSVDGPGSIAADGTYRRLATNCINALS